MVAWLVRDGEVLASFDIADRHRDRLRGFLGRDGIDGALFIRGICSVHTFGMKFDLDVAFLDKDERVVKVVEMRRHRLSAPVWSARSLEIRVWAMSSAREPVSAQT